MNRAVQFIYNRDRTGCAFPDGTLRPPPVADLPPKGAKGAAKGGAKGGPKATPKATPKAGTK